VERDLGVLGKWSLRFRKICLENIFFMIKNSVDFPEMFCQELLILITHKRSELCGGVKPQ
jgi:hypothetical protein